MGPTSETNDLMHVRELVDHGFHASIEAAESWLRRVGVKFEDGIFSRSALRAALSVSTIDPFVDLGRRRSTRTVLNACLLPFGLYCTELSLGRTSVAKIIASGPPRVVYAGTSPVSDDPAEPRGTPIDDTGVLVRLHVASRRRAGVAYFLTSGFDADDAPPLTVFLLADERRFWIARREDLLNFDRELRARGRDLRRRGRPTRYGRVGLAPHSERRGYLRVWMGATGLPVFEPHDRIGDADGQLVWWREEWIGGRRP